MNEITTYKQRFKSLIFGLTVVLIEISECTTTYVPFTLSFPSGGKSQHKNAIFYKCMNQILFIFLQNNIGIGKSS